MIKLGVSQDDGILNGWREIANYLQRTVRTVQRWEREAKLPVRRALDREQSPVMAIRSELDQWMQHRPAGNPRMAGEGGSIVEDFLASMKQAHELHLQMRQSRQELAVVRAAFRETVRRTLVSPARKQQTQ